MTIRPLSVAFFVAVSTAAAFGQATRPATPPTSRPASTSSAATSPATQPAMPHLRVDRAARLIDIDAAVVTREGKWMELLACKTGGREYESILNTAAQPSHIHLALLLLGVEPGSPLGWREEGDHIVPVPPRGPRIAVSLLYADGGKEVEVPANQWVLNQKTGQVMEGNTWIFTGSSTVEYEGKKIYVADANGTVLSLVAFGDDLLSRATQMTNQSDDATWGSNTAVIPAAGTAVRIRLRPIENAATQPATQRATMPAAPVAPR